MARRRMPCSPFLSSVWCVRQLEAEGIYLEQVLCYVNRAGGATASDSTSADGDGGVPASFYFIFTFREPRGAGGASKHTLRDWAFVDADGQRRPLLMGAEGKSTRELRAMLAEPGAVDKQALGELAKRVVTHFTTPYTRYSRRGGVVRAATCACNERGCRLEHAEFRSPLPDVCPLMPDTVSAFDFSARECLREAYAVNAHGQLCLPVGDALQEVAANGSNPGACRDTLRRSDGVAGSIRGWLAVLARGSRHQPRPAQLLGRMLGRQQMGDGQAARARRHIVRAAVPVRPLHRAALGQEPKGPQARRAILGRPRLTARPIDRRNAPSRIS
jgi:hypothetical protein